MNSYILLRNNKESASLTIDGLKEMGLKASDLIWVECQSVCWQHPYEIAELKSLVGGVPEYAKVKTVQPLEDFIENVPVVIEESKIHEAIREKEPERIIEKKSVYVELPAQKKTVNEVVKTATAYVKPVADPDLSYMQKYGGISNSETKPVENKAEDINTKYSRPLDEIKEMYVKNLVEKERKQKNKFAIKISPQAKKIAVYAGLVLAGALTMYFINGGSGKSKVIVQQVPQQPVQQTATNPTEIGNENEAAVVPVENADNAAATKNISVLSNEEKKSSDEGQSSSNKKIAEKSAEQNIGKNNDEIKTQPVDEIKEAKEITRTVPLENISSKLSLNPNNFVVGSFGGIRNLEMTLRNDSKYALNKVTAEINYLNPEGIILKTENVYFQSIAPGETSTVAVQKTKRGVKITYKIIKIEPKEINGSTAGL